MEPIKTKTGTEIVRGQRALFQLAVADQVQQKIGLVTSTLQLTNGDQQSVQLAVLELSDGQRRPNAFEFEADDLQGNRVHLRATFVEVKPEAVLDVDMTEPKPTPAPDPTPAV